MGGLNRTDDVRKVQVALNKVPAASGGPSKPLETTTGICGPKTIEAIQLFQIKHFGWSGADGRVDVNGVTHQKLNEFDGPVGGTTVDPVVTKEGISIRLDAGVRDSKPLTDEWRFLFTNEADQTSRVYRLSRTASFTPAPITVWGSSLTMSFDEPRTAADFHDALFAYSSKLHYIPNPPRFLWTNTMVLQPVGGERRTLLKPPWTIEECLMQAVSNLDVEKTYAAEVMGQLKLVEASRTTVPALPGPGFVSEAQKLQHHAALVAKRRKA
jgi:hypothetical protein